MSCNEPCQYPVAKPSSRAPVSGFFSPQVECQRDPCIYSAILEGNYMAIHFALKRNDLAVIAWSRWGGNKSAICDDQGRAAGVIDNAALAARSSTDVSSRAPM